MMAVLPALLEELAANQAAPELPQGYEQWLGSYGTKLVFLFFEVVCN